MTTLREKIHALGNWHNKISMASIVTSELLSNQNMSKLTGKERDKLINKAVKTLNKIGQYVVGADKIIEEIKPFIYKQIGADVKVPVETK
jgi:hypothetical protein